MNPKEQKVFEELRNVLLDAQNHLEYCGYGDSWERECAREIDLENRISNILKKSEKFINEKKSTK